MVFSCRQGARPKALVRLVLSCGDRSSSPCSASIGAFSLTSPPSIKSRLAAKWRPRAHLHHCYRGSIPIQAGPGWQCPEPTLPYTANADAERAERAINRLGPIITPELLTQFADATRKALRNEDGTFRREILRAIAQRVEIKSKVELEVAGCQVELFRSLAATNGVKAAALAIPSRVPVWRALLDTRANYSFEIPIEKPRRRNTTTGSLEVSRFVSTSDDNEVGH